MAKYRQIGKTIVFAPLSGIDVGDLEKRLSKEQNQYYTLVVDCGIPYSNDNLTKKELMKELHELEKKAEDSPQCDLWVYRNNKDVTKPIFKEYRRKRRK